MDTELKIGNVVYLNGQDLEMTIIGTFDDSPMLECAWFAGAILQKAILNKEALTLV